MRTLLRYYFTLKDLKWIQIRYQLWKRVFRSRYHQQKFHGSYEFLHLETDAYAYEVWDYGQCFNYINLEHCFEEEINWSFSAHGKLWNYNLNYFDFLNQKGMTREQAVQLMQSWLVDPEVEAYPTSLRLINWIRSISKFRINDQDIIDSVYSQGHYLHRNIEYHLMGNHLLENGFALLFAGVFLQSQVFLEKGIHIVREELNEQILDDGAHFELSPMYHSIILNRILEAIDLLKNNEGVDPKYNLLALLQEKASKMLGWMQAMQFENGDLPAVNDSTVGIAPPFDHLLKNADILNVTLTYQKLQESGYRKLNRQNMELLVDVGEIGPKYIPGHAHCDTLSFILYVNRLPLIVDTGISTYEKNQTRNDERSTSAHNTVQIVNHEQSDVWGGFRVGRKAQIVKLIEEDSVITASHNGYRNLKCVHQRSFKLVEDGLSIEDLLDQEREATAFFHFYYDIHLSIEENEVTWDGGVMSFSQSSEINLEDYQLAVGFNKTKTAQRVVVTFSKSLTTSIQF